jgi:hypothetical protein
MVLGGLERRKTNTILQGSRKVHKQYSKYVVVQVRKWPVACYGQSRRDGEFFGGTYHVTFSSRDQRIRNTQAVSVAALRCASLYG